MSTLDNNNILRTLAEKNMLISCRRLAEIFGLKSTEDIDALSKKLSYLAGKNHLQKVRPHAGGKYTYRITDAGRNHLAIITGTEITANSVPKQTEQEQERDDEFPITAHESEILHSLDNLAAQLEAPVERIIKQYTLEKLASILGKPLAIVLQQIAADIERI